MSDPQVLVIGPALNAEETAASVAMVQALGLPDTTNVVVSFGKFEAPGMTPYKVEAGYPADPVHLQTMDAWAGSPSPSIFRDAHDIMCVREIVRKVKGHSLALLVREPTGVAERWPELRDALGESMFLTFGRSDDGASLGGDNLLLRTEDEGVHRLLEVAYDLYRTGAAYGLEPYSLKAVFDVARAALDVEDEAFPPTKSEPEQGTADASTSPSDAAAAQEQPALPGG